MFENSKKKEYPIEDIEVIQLNESTLRYTLGFECNIDELEKFLTEDALNQTNQSINRTFLWISKTNKILLSYITICVDAISLDSILKEEMQKAGIKYKSLPALKICRMAVRKELTKKGIGKRMISFAINQAIKVHKESACRFITLDAKNDEKTPEHLKPIRFYKKLEFEELKRRKKDNTIHLFLDLINYTNPKN